MIQYQDGEYHGMRAMYKIKEEKKIDTLKGILQALTAALVLTLLMALIAYK